MSTAQDSIAALLPARRALPYHPAGREVLVREPVSGQVHFLNPAAAVVWECCDGEHSLPECIQRLRETFLVPEGADLAADVRETLAAFRQRGLLDG